MNPFPPRGAFYPPNMPPIPIPNLTNWIPGQFPPMPMGMMPLPVLPTAPNQAAMGITVPTGVASISAPPVRKITPNVIPNQNKPPYQMPHATVNKSQPTFKSQIKPKYTGPIITVFVGNINEKVSDIVIRQILDKCGNVTNWKRIKGPNGKLQAFGFCDYAEAESALRAIRLLNEFEIGDKKLLVRVDTKTQEKLDSYAKENKSNDDASNTEEDSKSKDDKALELINGLLKESEADLMSKSTSDENNSNDNQLQSQLQSNQKQQIPAEPNLQNFSDMDIEDEKKTLIHREIGKFRNTYKKQDEEKEKLEAERAREREFRKERERRDRDRERDRRERDRRDRDRLTPSRKLDSMNSNSSMRYERDRDRERDRYDRNDRIERMERIERNEREMSSRSYEDEETVEQRRQLREERKKELSYQKRLKDWESREDRKRRQYEKDQYRQIEKKKEEEKELLKLKQFLEDYNDDLNDVKYYKGSNFARKLRDFEKEQEDDERDRQLEKRELDDLRRKLGEEGHPDPESEAQKLMSNDKSTNLNNKSNDFNNGHHNHPNEEIHVKAFTLTKQDNRPQLKSNLSTTTTTTSTININSLNDDSGNALIEPQSDQQEESSTNEKKKKPLSLHDVFNSNEDDDKSQTAKKRKLPVFNDDTDSNQSLTNLTSLNKNSSNDSKQLSSDDKRKQIKALIDNIPTQKEDLFKYEIEWDYVDANLMEKRIRPWINKKITEYIGEEEKALLDFICGKLVARSDAQSILDDVAMVLDDEAEVFIVKMLRLLIYEIEAKKLGLVSK